jgi:1-deoxy-D-xylulose 5-phosphate reductoisomerase
MEKEIREKLVAVELRFKELVTLHDAVMQQARGHKIEMMRLQGEHRALTALLPAEEPKKPPKKGA